MKLIKKENSIILRFYRAFTFLLQFYFFYLSTLVALVVVVSVKSTVGICLPYSFHFLDSRQEVGK